MVMSPMAVSMEFGLLGPLVVRRDGQVISVPGGKPRAVLAALLLNADQQVAAGQLAEVLWGADPPPSARESLQNHVKRLRQALGPDGRARIVTRPGGYAIRVASGELDVTRFQAALTSARAAARDRSWDKASAQASAALLLWRGEPLADVGSELLAQRMLPHLTEIWLQARETRLEAEIELGRHAETVVELRRLVAEHPLREHLHALLMLALRQCGQRADALTAYQAARRILIAELGAEPGPELRREHEQILVSDRDAVTAPDRAVPDAGTRHTVVPRQPPAPVQDVVGRDAELHQRILADGAALAPRADHSAPGAPIPVTAPGPAVPQELPGAVRHFTGRVQELAALDALFGRDAGDTPTGAVISVICGTAGVGKTALALHWAHQAVARFPDGQLYVNLRGYDPGQPMPASEALARFLRALGIPGQNIPAEEDERAARYRSLLAGRRMLIVLDNASQVEQVRPLLPGTPACMALVTSRDALPGLVALDGAARLNLDLMPLSDAVALLRALIGVSVDADPAAAVALATWCSRLPLALRIAAERVITQPASSLASLAGELAGQRQLDLLDASGDPRTVIRAVFSWSYLRLDPATGHAFRLLGLHPGPDFEHYATAALAGITTEEASRVLSVLARAHLIQPTRPGRYGMHDLLRGYARDLHADEGGKQERHAALTRLFDHYLHAAATAMNVLFPAERYRRPTVPAPGTPVPVITSRARTQAWLDAERLCLAAVVAQAAAGGWPSHATRLASTLFRYLDTGGHYPEAIVILGHARRAASSTGDKAAEADALTSLGLFYGHQGRHRQAAGHLEQALARCRETGDQAGQARALSYLGLSACQQGRDRHGTSMLEQSLALFRAAGDRTGEAFALSNLGVAERRQGLLGPAADHQHQALAVLREIHNRHGEATVLERLAQLSLRQGRYQQAASYQRQALEVFREFGDRQGEATCNARLGIASLRQGHYQKAAVSLQRALTEYREISDLSGQAEALNGLGEVLLAQGRPVDARAQQAAALGLAGQVGDPEERARAHDGLARGYQSTGDLARARHHWEKALTLYAELGAAQAEQVRVQLTTLGAPGVPPPKPRPPQKMTAPRAGGAPHGPPDLADQRREIAADAGEEGAVGPV
jgi:DNA-binding SARP family transcriptional activator/Tfp pilus assembly protein PilF